MKENDLILFSSLIFLLGSLVLIFGAILHNTYAYSSSFEDALRIHASVTFVMLCGIAVAILGLLGMITGAVKHKM